MDSRFIYLCTNLKCIEKGKNIVYDAKKICMPKKRRRYREIKENVIDDFCPFCNYALYVVRKDKILISNKLEV